MPKPRLKSQVIKKKAENKALKDLTISIKPLDERNFTQIAFLPPFPTTATSIAHKSHSGTAGLLICLRAT
ncbi:hypothetical protein L596_000092 [Steinernema carpocapsae]|uniref:Uncharacterized protein n=1 Tax=Steinernema carpocapsae TaxID=34508 RepID=A0A4U8UHU9_STECR|nr:hypothetical protein L596_000092 [Steinernema carpocapsae]